MVRDALRPLDALGEAERADGEGGTGGVTAAFRLLTLVWLLWVIYPVHDLVTSPRPAPAVAIGVVLLVGFVAVYLRLMLADPFGPEPSWASSHLVALTAGALLGAAVFGEGWGGLAIYAATALASYLPSRWPTIALLLGLGAANAAVQALAGVPAAELASLSILTAAVGVSIPSTGRLFGMIAELRASRATIARLAVAQERERFARDLHDLLGHSLSLIALKSGLAGRVLTSDPDRASAEIRDVERVAREALTEVRDAVEGYRVPDLDRELARARRTLEAAGVEAEVGPAPDGLPVAATVALAWAVREAITNVVRHAGAGHCGVTVTRAAGPAGAAEGEVLRLEVRDDGRGPAASAPRGGGIDGLRGRLDAVSGTVQVGHAPGGGFRLLAEVPLLGPRPQAAGLTAAGGAR